MSDEALVALLAAIKTYLQITWEDANTDARISELILAGAAYLDNKLCGDGNYAEPGIERTLLFEYVRYARDGATDVFENNYRSMILTAQHERMLFAYDDEESTF